MLPLHRTPRSSPATDWLPRFYVDALPGRWPRCVPAACEARPRGFRSTYDALPRASLFLTFAAAQTLDRLTAENRPGGLSPARLRALATLTRLCRGGWTFAALDALAADVRAALAAAADVPPGRP